MRFLLDQDVYGSTFLLLTALGHDVLRAPEAGLSQAEDSDLLTAAGELDRILITRDRDFGSLVFMSKMGMGVIYLRVLPSTQEAVHLELERVLSSYTESDLHGAFVVVEAGRHRFRKLSRQA